MLQKVRKKIVRSTMIKLVICIAIIIGTLLFTDMAPIKKIKGPEIADIDENSIDSYDNKYISLDIKYMSVQYLEEETTTTSRYGSKSKAITANYYVAANEYSKYFAVLAKGEADMEDVDRHLNSSTNGVIPVEYKGTFHKLSDSEYSYLKSFMSEYGFAEAEYSKYIFKVNYIGKCSDGEVFVSFLIIIGAFLYALLSAIRGFSGRYVRDVKKFAANNGMTFDQLSMELDRAYEVNGVWLNSKHTAFNKSNRIKIVKTSDFIWAYYKETRTKRRGATSITRQLALADRKKKLTLIGITSEEDARKILGYYAETQPQMVLGYNEDLQRVFKNNFEQFLLLPYQNNTSNEEVAPSEEFNPEEYVPESYLPEQEPTKYNNL